MQDMPGPWRAPAIGVPEKGPSAVDTFNAALGAAAAALALGAEVLRFLRDRRVRNRPQASEEADEES